MKFSSLRFNSYFLGLLVALFTACATTQPGGDAKAAKDVATLRVHLETHPDQLGLSHQITVGRTERQTFFVTPPMLHEHYLSVASIWEGKEDQFAIHLQFNAEGARLLEMLSMSYRGKRLAVMSQFPEPRWLGTVRMDRRIADGTLLLRADTTREEAYLLVRRLNNTVAKLKNK